MPRGRRRVAEGGHPPPAPTDPDVRNSHRSRCPVHLSLRKPHSPARRFPPPGPLGRVPRHRRYHQRTPTSRRPSRRASFPSLGGTTVCPVRSRPERTVPAGRDCCLSRPPMPHRRWRRRDLPGSWATLARMPRSRTPAEPDTPDLLGAPVVPSALVTASASATYTHFRGSITRPAGLPVYASQPGSPPNHATLGPGWLANLGRTGLSPAGSHRRFPS